MVVLLALLVLGTLAGAIIIMTSGHLMHAQTGNESQEALYAARAGAYMMLGRIRNGDLRPIPKTAFPSNRSSFSAKVTVGSPSRPFPPEGTYYVEGVGYSTGNKERRVGILASITESRWNHAAFGSTEVVMMSGSYTDSFNSDGRAYNHSEASIATNNPVDGIKIEDYESVVIGWSGSIEGGEKDRKGRRDKGEGDPKLVAEADVQGPPGSSESQVVKGSNANRSYNSFVNASSEANLDPVVLPAIGSEVPVGKGGRVTRNSPYPSLNVEDPNTLIKPGAYNQLDVSAAGEAILDVSDAEPGSVVSYVFNGIHLRGGVLSIKQPPSPAAPVTVKVYVDTGDGSDPLRNVEMKGSSVINPSQKPVNFQLLIAGKGKNTLEGFEMGKDKTAVPSAYYVAYAPEGEILVSRGQIYGAVVGNRVVLEGDGSLTSREVEPGVIHFDTALLEDTANPPILNILSVRQY